MIFLVSAENVHGVMQHGRRTIYTAGRPPWYDLKGELKEAFVIGKPTLPQTVGIAIPL